MTKFQPGDKVWHVQWGMRTLVPSETSGWVRLETVAGQFEEIEVNGYASPLHEAPTLYTLQEAGNRHLFDYWTWRVSQPRTQSPEEAVKAAKDWLQGIRGGRP